MSIVKIEDFTGIAALSSNIYTEDELQDFIDLNEGNYMCQLLGKELTHIIPFI